MISRHFSVSLPAYVRFGEGSSRDVLDHLPNGKRPIALIRGSSGIAAAPLLDQFRAQGIELIETPCAGEPTLDGVNIAVERLMPAEVTAVVAIGGGSVIDMGKAVAFCLGHGLRLAEDFDSIPSDLLSAAPLLRSIAIPTTAGTGAEVTANAVLGVPSKRAKISLRGRTFVPDVALIDPDLVASAPRQTLLTSGLDAVVQTIEAYTSNAATPFIDALTRPNIRVGLTALKQMLAGQTAEARRDLACVSLGSGMALANGGLGAAHGLASVVGGRYPISHGALCGLFIAPVLRQNLRRAAAGSSTEARLTECVEAIKQTFPPISDQDPLSGLEAWQSDQGLQRLSDLGVAEIDDLAQHSAKASSSRKNAVPLEPHDFKEILHDALS